MRFTDDSQIKRPALLFQRGAQTVEKAPFGIFSDETLLPCTFGAAGKNRKETLLRKASEADAHVVSFGMKVGWLRPSDTS